MADFCAACVVELFDVPREHNGLAGGTGPTWELCEGCGFHVFDHRGERLCGGRPDPLSPAGGLDDCPMCAELCRD